MLATMLAVMEHQPSEERRQGEGLDDPGTPGNRSGSGADSSWEHMKRDEQRRKNPDGGRKDRKEAEQDPPAPRGNPAN